MAKPEDLPTAQPAGAAAPAYHHGALREALLDAAEALLLEGGVQAFTLRECARRAGVSHAAPAYHFGDARGLLTAFATVGFERLAALMQRYRDEAPADAGLRLRAVGSAYIDFALQWPAHFRLMFGSDRLDATDGALQRAGQCTGDMLRQAMTEVAQASGLAAAELPARMLLAWSTVHGYATLAIEGQIQMLFDVGPHKVPQASRLGLQMLELLQPALAPQGAPAAAQPAWASAECGTGRTRKAHSTPATSKATPASVANSGARPRSKKA